MKKKTHFEAENRRRSFFLVLFAALVVLAVLKALGVNHIIDAGISSIIAFLVYNKK